MVILGSRIFYYRKEERRRKQQNNKAPDRRDTAGVQRVNNQPQEKKDLCSPSWHLSVICWCTATDKRKEHLKRNDRQIAKRKRDTFLSSRQQKDLQHLEHKAPVSQRPAPPQEDLDEDESEVCIMCQRYQPKQLTRMGRLVIVDWASCDKCNGWVHLKFCCVEIHVGRTCPLCKEGGRDVEE